MNRRNIITVLLIAAFITVVILSITNRSQHGDPAAWEKEHGKISSQHEDLDRFCLDCHQKKFGHTRENFCNECHTEKGVKPVK